MKRLMQNMFMFIGIFVVVFLFVHISFGGLKIINNEKEIFNYNPIVTFQSDGIGAILENVTKMKKDFTASKELEKKLISQTVGILMVGDGIGTCSGTVIYEDEKNHYVLTAKHCIGVTEEMYVEQNKVLFITTSVHDDLALLVIDGKIPNKTVAIMAEKDAVIGDEVHHVAYPNGIMYSKSGKVSRNTNDWQFYDFKAIGGCSGGGVFNENGDLIGALWGGFRFPEEEAPLKSISEPLKDIKAFFTVLD